MRSGRPPSWNIVEGFDGGVWTGVTELTSKDRLLIPSSARRRVDWLARASDLQVLAEVEDEGVVALRPWVPHGEAMREQLRKLAETLEPDQHRELALAAMDRYAKLTIGADGRMVLPAHLCHQLEFVGTEIARIVCSDNQLWLWSERRWRLGRRRRAERLEALLSGVQENQN